MKKYILIICAVFCFLTQSCIDDFLTQYPYSTSVSETFYETESQFKQALTGSYAMINASNANGKSVPYGTYYYGLIYMLEGCTDETIAGTASSSYFDIMRGSYQTDQPEIRQFWMAFYIGISRCNYLIEGVHNGKNKLTDEQKKQFEGEARFLRAFYYLHLAEMFGGVPLNTTSSADPLAGRDDLETVFNQIIEDFQFAYDNLNDEGINKSSANKWTAAAYLGTVYNYLASCKRYNVGSKYVKLCVLNSFRWVDADLMTQKAKTILQDVIENSPYELVEKSDYRKLFYEMSKSIQYKECLFMAEFADNTKHVMSTYYVLSPAGNAKVHGGSYQRTFPTMNLYLYYNDYDERRDRFITGMINPNGKYNNDLSKVPYEIVDNYKYYLPEASSGAASGQSSALWCTGKFRISDPQARVNIVNSQCVMNYPLMRMADVYLQYAEALYFSGEEEAARAELKKVRERTIADGYDVSVLTKAYYRSDFIDELLEERARELCFESKRKVDLIRFGRITDYISNLIDEGTNGLVYGVNLLKDNWREYKMWLPIPQLEIDLNKNLEQNPIYTE